MHNTRNTCMVDGTVDGVGAGSCLPSIQRSTPGSLDGSSLSPNPRRSLRFASTDHLQFTSDSAVTPGAELFDRLTRETPVFSNPFHSDGDAMSPTPTSSSGSSDYVRPNAFPGHRDTLARIKHPQIVHDHDQEHDCCSDCEDSSRQLPSQPASAMATILPCLSVSDHKTRRLTCCELRPMRPAPRLSAACRLPAEVLQRVYQNLLPVDFDAARHTCRAWYVASLDKTLLRPMLRRAQCWRAAEVDSHYRCIGHTHTTINSLQHQPEDEYLMSKRLATECKLSSEWEGSGWRHLSPKHTHGVPSPFVKTLEVNLADILPHGTANVPRSGRRSCTVFTVSTCQRYVLLGSGSTIWIFRLFGRQIPVEAVCQLRCRRQVLAVSMDTTFGRYAVGVLHEGRVGTCWELSAKLFPREHAHMPSDATTTIYERLPARQAEVGWASSPTDDKGTEMAVEELVETPRSRSLSPSEEKQFPGHKAVAGTLAGDHPNRVPMVLSQPAIFLGVGTAHDVPRSVAICPHRRCIAFGCRLGIELHGVDEATHMEQQCWLPRGAPTDHLHFLPRRPHNPASERLQLVSSTAVPNSNGVRPSRAGSAPSNYIGPQQGSPVEPQQRTSRIGSMTHLFFGSQPFPPAMAPSRPRPGTGPRQSLFSVPPDMPDERAGVFQTLDCDHYNAVPLSDGVHMLFMDPTSGLVSLGSDSPIGGPTKLLRKVFFNPPPLPPHEIAFCSSAAPPVPLCYTASRNLDWGCRIVAAYDDGRVVLYNVPSDMFDCLRHRKSLFGLDVGDEHSGTAVARSDLAMDAAMQTFTPRRQHGQQTQAQQSHSSIRPGLSYAAAVAGASHDEFLDENGVKPRGVLGCLIDVVRGSQVVDLAVDCDHGGCQVWGFCDDGVVMVWDVFDDGAGDGSGSGEDARWCWRDGDGDGA